MKKYIRFDVSNVVSSNDLKNIIDNIRKEEEVLKNQLYTLSYDCEEYNECLKKHNDIKIWIDILVNELTQCTIKKRQPTQHVQVHSSSAFFFQNILSPETIRRKFISFNAIIKSVALDIEKFLTYPEMRNDRKLVVQQIIDSIPIKRKLDH